jgi:hypothetical protein
MDEKPKRLKNHIVSFRIPKSEAVIVEKMLSDHAVLGVRSVSQWFRKVGRDRIAGRLAYKDEGYANVDSEICD